MLTQDLDFYGRSLPLSRADYARRYHHLAACRTPRVERESHPCENVLPDLEDSSRRWNIVQL